MKLKTITLFMALTALSSINHHVSTSFAQGPLTPPAGAPAPVMKSLDQVEARVPLVAGQPGVIASAAGTAGVYYAITNPGSYYLTTNVLATSGTAIFIRTNNVTLDLNGFAIIGSQSVGNAGISFGAPRTNIVIRNGNIQNCGYNGILDGTAGSQNLLIENICVTGCGSLYAGVKAGILTYSPSSLIRNCVAVENKGAGIASIGTVKDCVASRNTGNGFHCGGHVENCTASENSRSGIFVYGDAAVIINNICSMNNTLNSSEYAGIHTDVTASSALIINNHVTTDNVGIAGYGIRIDGFANVTAKNWVRGFGANNYLVASNGNDTGPVGTAAASTSPFANISK